MTTVLTQIERALQRAELPARPANWVVAFSGGLDSSVLLHALVQLRDTERVRAIHVNHGLQAEAGAWADACRAAAGELGVDITIAPVQVNLTSAVGLEAAARNARYAALAEQLRPGEVLLTAHHADDQLETMLLALLRGAGLRGLRGALALTPFGAGQMLRPLLGVSRSEILRWAQVQGITWLEDPSNRDRRFDRNYLRQEVLPALLARWPKAGAAASRAAGHLDAAVHITEQLAEQDIAGLDDPYRPLVRQLRQLSPDRQRYVLRALLRHQRLPVPSAARLDQLLGAVAGATASCRSLVQWTGAEARLYRGRLYLAPPLPASLPQASKPLAIDVPCAGPLGSISLGPAAAAGLPGQWASAGLVVRVRRGGECFQPAGAARPRSLKRLLADARVLPWIRPMLPLIYFEDDLVAVGNLWLSERAAVAGSETALRYQVLWQHSRVIF